MEGFKFWVTSLSGFFILSQIISYKKYGPYSLLCWNDVTVMFLLTGIGLGVVASIGTVIIYSLLWLLDKFEDNEDKKRNNIADDKDDEVSKKNLFSDYKSGDDFKKYLTKYKNSKNIVTFECDGDDKDDEYDEYDEIDDEYQKYLASLENDEDDEYRKYIALFENNKDKKS